MAKQQNKPGQCTHKWVLVNTERVKRFFSSITCFKYTYKCDRCKKTKTETKNQ